MIRPLLLDPDHPAATSANLLDHETLARTGIAVEMALVVAQVLAALWLFRLFRAVDPFAAGALAVFGVLNGVAQLGSAASLATALDAALGGLEGSTSQLMYLVSGNLWGVGNLFFGLWLIPMGRLVLRSGWAPRALGLLLVVGGAGYLVSAFAGFLAPGAELVAGLLVVPATVAELWMIGWLLATGLRRR